MMLTNHPVLLLPVAEGTSRTNTKVSVHAGDAAAQEGRQLVCSSKGCSFLLIERLQFQSLAACRSMLGQDTELRVVLNTRVDV